MEWFKFRCIDEHPLDVGDGPSRALTDPFVHFLLNSIVRPIKCWLVFNSVQDDNSSAPEIRGSGLDLSSRYVLLLHVDL